MKAGVFQVGYVNVDDNAVQRVANATKACVCVACLEAKPLPGHRGLCGGCYAATRRAILTGKTTEAERVAQGKLLPVGKVGRRPSNAVSIEVANG